MCTCYKKPKPRFAVGFSFSLAHEFKKKVARDFKSFRNGYILHLETHAARLRAGVMIYSKRKKVIIDKLFKHRIALFGTPKMFLFNNGGEFNNEDFREMREQLNIKGSFKNYVTLKLPFFSPPTPHYHATSRMITRPHLRYVTPDTGTPPLPAPRPLHHLFLFFEIEKKAKIRTHP